MKPWVKSVVTPSDTEADELLTSLMEEWPLLLSEPVPPKMARAHIAEAAAAASEAPTAAAPSARTASLRILRNTWRRRLALATITSTFVGQLLLGTAAVAAVGAGAAATGVLPPPLQSAVSNLAGQVGLELPSGTTSASPADPGEPGEPATPATPAVPASKAETSSEPQDFGLLHRPVAPPTPLTPAGVVTPPGHFDEFVELRAAIDAIRASHAAGHAAGHGPGGVPGPPDGVPGPPDGVPGQG